MAVLHGFSPPVQHRDLKVWTHKSLSLEKSYGTLDLFFCRCFFFFPYSIFSTNRPSHSHFCQVENVLLGVDGQWKLLDFGSWSDERILELKSCEFESVQFSSNLKDLTFKFGSKASDRWLWYLYQYGLSGEQFGNTIGWLDRYTRLEKPNFKGLDHSCTSTIGFQKSWIFLPTHQKTSKIISKTSNFGCDMLWYFGTQRPQTLVP